jgi:hypothetical protein
MEDGRLDDLYYTLVKITAELAGAGYSSMEIGAIMTRVALQIYKTSLSEQDYQKMVDFISSSRDEIEKFSLDVPLQ